MELPVKPEILTSYVRGLTFGNAESCLFVFAAQCFNIESMLKHCAANPKLEICFAVFCAEDVNRLAHSPVHSFYFIHSLFHFFYIHLFAFC
jgi:hypothetical protein